MAEMGRYCKAYYAADFRKFPGWKENTSSLRKERQEVNGKEVEVERTEIKDDDILYLQENFVVTDGIFKDENVVFDEVSPEWESFCKGELAFEIPDYARDEEPAPVESATAESAPQS
ncbi:MAG TPA: hypothetical protein VHG51_04770 [Longimicrobiaceae bacterium]|nr:hypothetical protein [Longimicrobiaceae bacterium]